jgi:gluconolactonase
MNRLLLCVLATGVAGCLGAFVLQAEDAQPAPAKAEKKAAKGEPVKVYPTCGDIERLDPAFDKLIPADTKIEKLAGGFGWAEGPVWDKRSQSLLFTDVPANAVYRWREGEATHAFIVGSGYTRSFPRGGEMGANGLALDSRGYLVLCQHGDRRVARLTKPLKAIGSKKEQEARFLARAGDYESVAEYFKDRRFNSPNDLVFNSKGDLYFTDPTYGLEKGEKDPRRELVFSGVYLVPKKGGLVLLTDRLSAPNGVALSPDEKTLYVAVSDPKQPVIMAYGLQADGTVDSGRVFFDAAPLVKDSAKGMPDGLKVDVAGNVFATGPGGVLVLSPEGKHLGTIRPGEITANCAWGGDGSTLFLTANNTLCRIKTATKGKGF